MVMVAVEASLLVLMPPARKLRDVPSEDVVLAVRFRVRSQAGGAAMRAGPTHGRTEARMEVGPPWGSVVAQLDKDGAEDTARGRGPPGCRWAGWYSMCLERRPGQWCVGAQSHAKRAVSAEVAVIPTTHPQREGRGRAPGRNLVRSEAGARRGTEGEMRCGRPRPR
jgi:hypothetical protein